MKPPRPHALKYLPSRHTKTDLFDVSKSARIPTLFFVFVRV